MLIDDPPFSCEHKGLADPLTNAEIAVHDGPKRALAEYCACGGFGNESLRTMPHEAVDRALVQIGCVNSCDGRLRRSAGHEALQSSFRNQ